MLSLQSIDILNSDFTSDLQRVLVECTAETDGQNRELSDEEEEKEEEKDETKVSTNA